MDATPVLYPPRIVSGIQPTPAAHLGHYFGALKHHVRLHHEYPGQTFFFIADYHALTRGFDPDVVRAGTLELATTYLAVGLDPNKATLYRQSDVPQATELAWILASLASPVGLLQRNPPYKVAAQDQNGSVSAGVLFYPVLMAADIAAVRGTIVPVGSDQQPNLDKARSILRAINSVVDGNLIPLPRTALTHQQVVPGTDGKKMSHHDSNAINIFERFDRLREKTRQILTDSKSKYEPKVPETCTVFNLYSLVASPDQTESLRRRYLEGAVGYDDAKRELTLAIQECFAEFADRYEELKKQPDFVRDVLREGFQQASSQAKEVLAHVRELVGLSH